MFGSLGLNSGKVLSDCADMSVPFHVRMKINNVHELVDVNRKIPSFLTPCNICEPNPAMRLTHLLSPQPGEFHKSKSLHNSYKRQFYYRRHKNVNVNSDITFTNKRVGKKLCIEHYVIFIFQRSGIRRGT